MLGGHWPEGWLLAGWWGWQAGIGERVPVSAGMVGLGGVLGPEVLAKLLLCGVPRALP